MPFPAYLLLRGPLRFASTNLPFVLSSARLASSAAGGGDEQNRTVDPLLARQVLSQLSYTPRYYRGLLLTLALFFFSEELVGSSGLEPPTSRLSGARSNHLSYEPIHECSCLPRFEYVLAHSKLNNTYLKQLP